TLEYKIKKINELITAYQSTSLPTNLAEAEQILNQQVGFEKQNEKILRILKIRGYCQQNNVQETPLILCLFGSPGVGKTTYARLLSQALKKEFFLVSLGGTTDTSLLLGASENSSGTEIGQLTKALTETKTHYPLILLDEIDKVTSYRSNSAIHNCLNAVLDSAQNKEILDYYLDVKLDFSQTTFVITANDPKKIPEHLLSRISTVDNQEKNSVDEKKELESLRKELERLKEKKDNQAQLKTVRFNSLLALRQIRGQFTDREYQDYEGKINTASSREEIEVVMKEFLLRTKEKITSPRTRGENGDKKSKDESTEIARQNQILTEKIKSLSAEIENGVYGVSELPTTYRSGGFSVPRQGYHL
ncbi:1705_t:CDS:2, partial [Racocetra persica]